LPRSYRRQPDFSVKSNIDSKREAIMIKAFARRPRLFGAIIAVSTLAGAAVSAQAAGYCSRASQCRGPLPQICERCSNGRTVCAHWGCVAHKCTVQICGRVTRYK
jgi:hypothetical protein